MSTGSIHEAFRNKQASKFLEPCEEQSRASYKCLDRNNYDKKKCRKYFLDYKECKRKWLEERKELRRQGLL
ncbi:2085_t:CDS:2 [Paraglomus brasilianum]|uniref:2085_t:CDS:1 n=1 Tax=Paraglomus brasilianum TaxID=144538 RepID=A0A9N9GZ44_9GLOM|nr:2085_t:CDS:2 [Paraglomus brasilianum]